MDVKKGLKSDSLILRGRYDPFKKLKAGFGGLPEEVEAYIPSSFTIVMDAKKKSIASHANETGSNTIEAQNYLKYLSENDKIYVPKEDGEVDKVKLAALHKPYYISNKRILRAYYA